MRMGRIDMEQDWTGPNAVLRVRGTVHIENSFELRNVLQRLVRKQTPAIVVSFEKAERVDTSGLATLMECAGDMQAYGGRLLVSGLNSQVADAYSLAQAAEAFPVLETVAEAIADLREQDSTV